jgi:phenylacetate-CoA ligase
MLVGRDDNLISVTALNLHTNEFDHVEQLQFRQSLPGRVDICVKPHASFSVADERRILLALRAKMGDTMDIALVVVEDIPLTTSGKFRFVVHGDP